MSRQKAEGRRQEAGVGAGLPRPYAGGRWRRAKFFAVLALSGLLALGFTACGGSANTLQPPEIAYGQEMCDECGMIISEAPFAAATIDLKGQPHKFDDVGDMLAFHVKHPEVQVKAWFVHDYNDHTWLRGETAFYVQGASIASPMGHGIAAFREQGAAGAYAARVNAKALSFDDLRIATHLAIHGAP